MLQHYGMANRYGLFVKLMQRRISDKLLRLLEFWFSIGSTCVKWYSYFSCTFCLSCDCMHLCYV